VAYGVESGVDVIDLVDGLLRVKEVCFMFMSFMSACDSAAQLLLVAAAARESSVLIDRY